MDTALVILIVACFVGVMAPVTFAGLLGNHPANQAEGDDE
jgi:hypothetical protein